jgi:hypothetical protein
MSEAITREQRRDLSYNKNHRCVVVDKAPSNVNAKLVCHGTGEQYVSFIDDLSLNN